MTQELEGVAPVQQQIVYAQQPARGTSGMAVASLVLGIVWLGGLGSLLAVLFGAVGLKQTKNGEAGGRGLAVAGLVLGIIGLVGASLLIGVFILGHSVQNQFVDTCKQMATTAEQLGQCSG